MNDIELNCILFYADYLSLKACSQPVTDNCKYFFIYGQPVNSAFILNSEPMYDSENKYLLEAYQHYELIKDQYSEDGVQSFINDICFIRACGMVDAERMLAWIHMFDTKQERKQAFNEYREWKRNNKYTHQVTDENGNPQRVECTKYVAHAERLLKRRKLLKGPGPDRASLEEQTS